MMQPRIFINSLEPYRVTFEQQGDSWLAKGLPLMRVGKYNGTDYTAKDLQKVADNFATIQQEDAFEPALSPHHQYDDEGKPVEMDAGQICGYFKALRTDADGTLLGDPLVDAETKELIENGKYRYNSTEIDWHYQLQAEDAKDIGPALVGSAWVTYPASRRMPMELLLNAQQFPQLFNAGDVHVQGMGDLSADDLQLKIAEILADWSEYASDDTGPWVQEVYAEYVIVQFDGKYFRHSYSVEGAEVSVSQQRTEMKKTWETIKATDNLSNEGGSKMVSIADAWSAIVEKFRGGEGDVKDLEVFGERIEDEHLTSASDVTKNTPEGGEDTTMNDKDDDQRARQVTMLEEHSANQDKEIAMLKQARQRDQCEAQVNDLVRAGHIPPAVKQHAYLLLEGMAGNDQKVSVLSQDAEGKEQTTEATMAEVLQSLIQGMGLAQQVPTQLRGIGFEGEIDMASEAALDKQSDEVGEAAADRLMASQAPEAGAMPAES